VCPPESDERDAVNEKSENADPWELPEFTHTTIPWRGIEKYTYCRFTLSHVIVKFINEIWYNCSKF
jgi:hypothetical protein